ncbi:hypothetical protein HMPREF9145_2686 [Segatella salivae F0493]|uniref:Uncharacterized protein n=1 Tax=Segatella salivae F0493 TaxID=1395125 RepID=U2MEM6_9BACT|nr:hypothetical protein HMPREF9145_2686 [Segatella salivae F0493]
MLAGLPQTVSQKVWHFRARRKSFPEGFGISALGEISFTKKDKTKPLQNFSYILPFLNIFCTFIV